MGRRETSPHRFASRAPPHLAPVVGGRTVALRGDGTRRATLANPGRVRGVARRGKFALAVSGHTPYAIEQAMGTLAGREAGYQFLSDFIAEMKASGFVAAALLRHGEKTAQVAP